MHKNKYILCDTHYLYFYVQIPLLLTKLQAQHVLFHAV